MSRNIIVFNAGSSSLKFSIFAAEGLSLLIKGSVDGILATPRFKVVDADNNIIFDKSGFQQGFDAALDVVFKWLETNNVYGDLAAAGHRVVHGGREFSKPVVIDDNTLQKLKKLIHLAPLHQPYNIAVIERFGKQCPNVRQVACFDTAFHRTQSRVAESFALPPQYADEGIIRYGFHGLSYQHIVSVLPQYGSFDKVVAVHLGNGASACAISGGKSRATTMGFTALDGLMMGTRCGSIDAGVLFYLMEEKNMPQNEIKRLLYNESGLKGVSGISSDIRNLQDSTEPEAKYAIDLFCYNAARQISSLIPSIKGIEALIFTAGIGEYSSKVRKGICGYLSWLGIEIDDKDNLNNSAVISSSASKIKVLIVPANEELEIARLTLS